LCGVAVASFDGTDIMMPVAVDNSTGVPQFREVDDYDEAAQLKSKRAATPGRSRLWPNGTIYFKFHNDITGS